ncbi:hypothetical protein O9929_17560 [Vibrio lentus]|nr:hypothetical protein [Vibrio lentus]
MLEVLSSGTIIKKCYHCRKNITLVDARKLSDTRYSRHDTFNQQITIADTIVGIKVDLYKVAMQKNWLKIRGTGCPRDANSYLPITVRSFRRVL